MAKKDSTPVNLRPYNFHGMEWTQHVGEQVVGTCPACGKEDHFYVNKDSGQFDCKKCGETGNKHTFLQLLLDAWSEETTAAQWKALSRNRGLPVSALKAAELAFDSYNERWLIPVRNPSTSAMSDLRVWSDRDNMNRSTKGMKSGLWNGQALLSPRKRKWPVWLCEGEWDGIALQYVVRRCKAQVVVVAVPGAGTFKPEWVSLFNDRDVILAYDHDDAGRSGLEKVAHGQHDVDGNLLKPGILASNTRSLAYVRWLSAMPDGYDVRDVIRSAPSTHEAWDVLTTLVSEFPDATSGRRERRRRRSLGEDEPTVAERAAGRTRAALSDEERPTFYDVIEEFRSTDIVITPDFSDALKVSLAVSVARQFDEDPLWMYMIGTPGSGKTLITNSFRSAEGCVFQSTLTRTALLSGYQTSGDPSLFAVLSGQCLVLKDFTEILSQNQADQDEVFSLLRGAYDGHVRRVFGNDVVREYHNLRFSFLAACTPEINSVSKATMGERFLKFLLPDPEVKYVEEDGSQDDIYWSAMNSVGHRVRNESITENAVARFLNYEIPEDVFEGRMPLRFKRRIHALCQLIGQLRATVSRNWKGEVTVRPAPEVGTRLAKQLVILGCALAEVSGTKELSDRDYRLVERVAFDTATGWNLDVVQALMERDKDDNGTGAKDLATYARLPETNTRGRLAELCDLGILRKRYDENATRRATRYFYHVAEHIRKLWLAAEVGASDHVTRSVKARRRRTKR